VRSHVATWLTAVLLAPGPAVAGTIQGQLSPGAHGTPASSVAPWAITDAVIYVDQVSPAAERKLARHGFWIFGSSTPRVWSIVLQSRRFDPRVLVAPVGDRLSFHNLDKVYHQAFSVSAAKRFDFGKRLPGQSDTLTLDQAGVINLHCEIHPDMAGYVVVTPNHAFALPGPDGRFRLPPLPPGRYSVRVFHPRWGQLRKSVDVTRAGSTDLALSF